MRIYRDYRVYSKVMADFSAIGSPDPASLCGSSVRVGGMLIVPFEQLDKLAVDLRVLRSEDTQIYASVRESFAISTSANIAAEKPTMRFCQIDSTSRHPHRVKFWTAFQTSVW